MTDDLICLEMQIRDVTCVRIEFVRIQVEKYSYIHDDYITDTHEYFSPADATY